MKRLLLPRSYNYRAILVRFSVNVLVLLFTVWIVPHIQFAGERRILSVLLIAAVFGVLNAFVKPLIQFLVLPFLFVSYGIVVVLINSSMLLLLSFIFPNRFMVDRLLWAVVGGIVAGLLGNLLETVAGLSAPILESPPPWVTAQAQRQGQGPVGRLVDEATGEDVPPAPAGEAQPADEPPPVDETPPATEAEKSGPGSGL